jgi:type IV pilus assembly protein PilO
MTNLQQGSSRLPVATLRLIWLTLPAAVLGGLGLLVVMAGLLPLWAALQRDSQRLQELGQLRDQVTLMRGQLVATRENTETAMASKAKIERLITGYSDLSTFLATLDREADASDVQLTLFEPTQAAATPGTAPGAAAAAPAAAPAPGAAAPAPGAAAPDPLALEGLTLRTLLVSARGSFPALLAFLRRLEALNVLVVQSDLNLTLPEAAASEGGTPKPSNEVVMKLTLGLYSRTPAPVPPAAAAPAAAPAPAPAAAPAPAPATPATPATPN